MEGVTIQRVNAKTHAEELYDFQLRCFPSDHVLAVEAGGDWWLAYHPDQEEPIAFAGLTVSARFSDCGYLCRAGVLPSFQGYGLQKRLIRVRCARAKSKGWRTVFTDTTDTPASANSLIACGFKNYIPAVRYCFPATIYWRKKL